MGFVVLCTQTQEFEAYYGLAEPEHEAAQVAGRSQEL